MTSSTLTAPRYSWCLVVQHLYEAAWDSYRERSGSGIHQNIRNALDEVVKIECVADMLSELATENDVIKKLQTQVFFVVGC